jgi:hypothetical protein
MEAVMSLPARELRVLSGIEAALQAGEARLTSMFAIFTRLATDEGKPGTEDLGTPSRNLWAAGLPAVRLRAMALLAALAIASAVLFSVTASRAPGGATACQSSPPLPAAHGGARVCGPAIPAHTFRPIP